MGVFNRADEVVGRHDFSVSPPPEENFSAEVHGVRQRDAGLVFEEELAGRESALNFGKVEASIHALKPMDASGFEQGVDATDRIAEARTFSVGWSRKSSSLDTWPRRRKEKRPPAFPQTAFES